MGPLAAACAFAALCAAVAARWVVGADRVATETMQALGNAPLDWALSIYTYLGSAELTGPAALLLAVVAARRVGRAAAVRLLCALAVISAIEVAGKASLPQPGPGPAFDRSRIRARLFHVRTRYAFPSGHTLRTTYLALAAAWLRAAPRPAPFAVAGGAALLMGLSRVYLGDHWASDVAGGWLLGLCGFLYLARRRRGIFPVSWNRTG